MRPLDIRNYNNTPEGRIRTALVKKMQGEGWCVRVIHGNEFQKGLPDLFACHASYGQRWVETKVPDNFKLKDTQHHMFLALTQHKVGVWILTAATSWEYNKLFAPANWHTFTQIMRSNRVSKPIEEWKDPRAQADGPERQLQNKIKVTLEAENWLCIDTYGSMYQAGLPDLYICHAKYGTRWLEVKNPAGFRFTPAQLKTFPAFTAEGCGVWVAKDHTKEYLSNLLFSPANWWQELGVMQT